MGKWGKINLSQLTNSKKTISMMKLWSILQSHFSSSKPNGTGPKQKTTPPHYLTIWQLLTQNVIHINTLKVQLLITNFHQIFPSKSFMYIHKHIYMYMYMYFLWGLIISILRMNSYIGEWQCILKGKRQVFPAMCPECWQPLFFFS